MTDAAVYASTAPTGGGQRWTWPRRRHTSSSCLQLDDKLQRLLSVVSKSVDSNAKARRDRDIVARYETTRAYVAAAAKKAWRARRRNEGLVNEPEGSLPEASPE